MPDKDVKLIDRCLQVSSSCSIELLLVTTSLAFIVAVYALSDAILLAATCSWQLAVASWCCHKCSSAFRNEVFTQQCLMRKHTLQ
jgi:hypothetical protein